MPTVEKMIPLGEGGVAEAIKQLPPNAVFNGVVVGVVQGNPHTLIGLLMGAPSVKPSLAMVQSVLERFGVELGQLSSLMIERNPRRAIDLVRIMWAENDEDKQAAEELVAAIRALTRYRLAPN